MDYQQLLKLMEKQKVEMTEQERFQAYFSGKEVDFLPYNLLAVEQCLANICGYTTSKLHNNFEIMSEIIERKKEFYGVEGISIGLDLRTIGAALGSELEYPEVGIEHVKSYILNDYKNINTLEIVETRNNPVLSPMLELTKGLKDRFPNMPISTFVSGPFSAASAIRPVESLLRDTRKNINELNQLLEFTNECTLNWVKNYCEEFGPIGILISDPVTCSDILSLDQFRSLSLPHLEYLIDQIVEITEIKPVLHICGRSKPLWADIRNLNISTFSVDNCEDLEEVKKHLGDKVTIWGNVPPVEVMMEGTIDDVIESCRECIEKCGDSPKGYQLNTGCQVPIGTPKENLDAFVYAARKYGHAAKIGEMPRGILEG